MLCKKLTFFFFRNQYVLPLFSESSEWDSVLVRLVMGFGAEAEDGGAKESTIRGERYSYHPETANYYGIITRRRAIHATLFWKIAKERNKKMAARATRGWGW